MIHKAASARSNAAGLMKLLPALVTPLLGQLPVVPVLERSRAGRALSESRYRNAESFFLAIEEGRFSSVRDLLYQSGIVAQMALSSHLLDVGFDDQWCARNIGLDISKALDFANATGLNHRCPEFARLAAILSPYSQWRNPDTTGLRPSAPASLPDIPALLRALLDHVRDLTGHARPAGKRTSG